MGSNLIAILGFTAALLTTSSLLPQLIKSYKSKSTKDVSLGLGILLSIGVALWLIYGIFRNDAAVISANAVSLVFSSALLGLKIKYK